MSSARIDSFDELVGRLRAAGCVFAEDEARLIRAAAPTPSEREAMVQRRAAGEPLEYVVGFVEFCGLRIALTDGVFIPRQRTEFLVGAAAAAIGPAGATVVDLCCGCGAIGVALEHIADAAGSGAVELHAVDIDPLAVRCARRNVDPVGGHVYEGDLFSPLSSTLKGAVDLVVANVPYVPTGELRLMPREARDHEPVATLDGGADGLDVLRRAAFEAASWLRPGGRVMFEVYDAQAPSAAEALTARGLSADIVEAGDGYTSVVVGTKPAGSSPR